MDEKYDYDLFVIGAGSGGTRAARVAAGYGARVAVAEEFRVGGTCVIRGCVPKKLLVYGAHFTEDLQDAARFGWQVPKSQFDWPRLRDNILEEVKRISAAYTRTLESKGVHIIHQRAMVSGSNQVTLADGQVRTAAKVLIAVGARPFVPQFPGAEHGITSNDAFHLSTLPNRVLIAGAGYIANEFAGIFDRFGAHVTVMNRTGVILRGYDESICDRLLQISQRKGIEFRFHATFKEIERNQDGSLTVSMTNYDPLTVDMVMFATGRVPNTDNLGLEGVGVELDKDGAIVVNDYNKSTCDSIYAVGDVTNRIQLTPVAILEGQAFADTAFGRERVRVAYENVPSAVFTQPPIASVGVTEAVARAKFRSVKVYTADFLPMKNALAGRQERALYKMVCDGETDQVVGLHMIGPDSPEILQAAAIAVRAGLTKAVFDQTVALHPTMAEELVLMK